jgi:hypothetical protein
LRGSNCNAPAALPFRALVGTNQSSLGEQEVADFLEMSQGFYNPESMSIMWYNYKTYVAIKTPD